MDRQVFRLQGAAARHHQTAGAVAAGIDIRIRDLYHGSLPIGKHAVSVRPVSRDSGIFNGKGGAVCRENSSILTVEISFVPIGFTGFRNCDAGIRGFRAVSLDRVAAIRGILIAFDGGFCHRFRRRIQGGAEGCRTQTGGQHCRCGQQGTVFFNYFVFHVFSFPVLSMFSCQICRAVLLLYPPDTSVCYSRNLKPG